MKLFKLENNNLVITPEALTIGAFSAIYKRDKNRSKVNAIKEFSYIYFMIDPRSDYMYLSDLKDRSDLIKNHIGIATKIENDKEIKIAGEVYKQLITTTSSKLLKSTLSIANKITECLDNVETVNLDNLKEVLNATKDLPSIIETLQNVEAKIHKEIEEESNMRGSKVKKILEDGIGQYINE